MLQELKALAYKSWQLAAAHEADAQDDARRSTLVEKRDSLRREHAALRQALEDRRAAAFVRDRLLARELDAAVRDAGAATAHVVGTAAGGMDGEGREPAGQAGAEMAMPIPPSLLDQVWEEATLREKEDRLHALKMAYRLSGKYVSILSNGRLGLRFDVFYKADFKGTYYAVVRHDLESDALILENHTLPHFIDVASIAKAWLPASVKLFMEALCDQLHMYVARREQLRQLADAWRGVVAPPEGDAWHPRPVLLALRHDDAVCHAEMEAAFCARRVLVSLRFADVSSSSPTSVTASLLPPGGGGADGAIHGLPRAESAPLLPVPETCKGQAGSWREVLMSGRLLEGMELLMDAAASADAE